MGTQTSEKGLPVGARAKVAEQCYENGSGNFGETIK